MNINNHLTEKDRAAIDAAIAEVERKTPGEVVPVVAAASGRYDRAEDFAGLAFGLTAMIGTWILFQRETTPDDWNALPLALPFLWIVVVFIVMFIIGMVLATQLWFLRRLFTSSKHMRDEVAEKARQVFFDQRIHRTQSRDGLLIYISLYEKLALLLADESVEQAIGEAGLNELRDQLIADLKRGNLAEALCAVIHEAGNKMADKMPPPDKDDQDELANTLVVLD